MEIALAVVVAAAVAGIGIAVWTRRNIDRRSSRSDSGLHRARAESAAEVEEGDVDAMLTAIDDYRRRGGRRSVGEELSDEAMRSDWEKDR